jgi:hypothetical protein
LFTFIAVYKGIAFDEPPLTVTMLRPSALDKIQELLLLGDRRQAYQFAMDGKLWAHAMVIASSIDKDSWKEVVNDFIRTELGIKDDVGLSPSTTFSGDPVAGSKGNWDSLRVAYSLFSGQGAASGRQHLPIVSYRSSIFLSAGTSASQLFSTESQGRPSAFDTFYY